MIPALWPVRFSQTGSEGWAHSHLSWWIRSSGKSEPITAIHITALRSHYTFDRFLYLISYNSFFDSPYSSAIIGIERWHRIQNYVALHDQYLSFPFSQNSNSVLITSHPPLSRAEKDLQLPQTSLIPIRYCWCYWWSQVLGEFFHNSWLIFFLPTTNTTTFIYLPSLVTVKKRSNVPSIFQNKNHFKTIRGR